MPLAAMRLDVYWTKGNMAGTRPFTQPLARPPPIPSLSAGFRFKTPPTSQKSITLNLCTRVCRHTGPRHVPRRKKYNASGVINPTPRREKVVDPNAVAGAVTGRCSFGIPPAAFHQRVWISLQGCHCECGYAAIGLRCAGHETKRRLQTEVIAVDVAPGVVIHGHGGAAAAPARRPAVNCSRGSRCGSSPLKRLGDGTRPRTSTKAPGRSNRTTSDRTEFGAISGSWSTSRVASSSSFKVFTTGQNYNLRTAISAIK